MDSSAIQVHPLVPGAAAGHFVALDLTPAPTASAAPLPAADPQVEVERFRDKLAALVDDLQEAVASLASESLTAEAEIMRTHMALLKDPAFHRQVTGAIQQTSMAAEQAVEHVAESTARTLEASGSPIFSARAADFRDLAYRLKIKLAEEQPEPLWQQVSALADPVLGLAELLPSVVMEGRKHGVRAFVVARGTAFSHGAILARSFGIPAVATDDSQALATLQGKIVLVDADNGVLLPEPDAEQLAAHARATTAERDAAAPLAAGIKLWASIVAPEQLEELDWSGIEGVGLYRTEMLFIGRRTDFPSEEEQFQTYRRLFQLTGDRPVTVRTVDLGGDKIAPYLSLGPQDNPYLGLRANRIYHFHPEILITQLRALLRAAVGTQHLHILYPLVETVDQWLEIQRMLKETVAQLRAEGRPFQAHFRQGALIETPSAVWQAKPLMEAADFASVGTNDLVQYLFAIDRNNPNVAELYQPEHPVVLCALRQLRNIACRLKKPLSICGEMAADISLLPLLVGLGLQEFTVAAGRLPAVGAAMRSLRIDVCKALAKAALASTTVAEVRALLRKEHGSHGTRRPPPAAGPNRALDPVCGMAVHVENNPYYRDESGNRYYFCSQSCMARFGRAPHS